MSGRRSTAKQARAFTPVNEPESEDMESLGLFMDAVPFQTLGSIADGLEKRLDQLSTSMFQPPVESGPETPHRVGGETMSSLSASEGRRTKEAFMTETELEDTPLPAMSLTREQIMPIKAVEDVKVDYQALLQGPRPPPNCDPAQLLQSVSDEIEFPKQWMRESWNKHFLSPLSLCIMQDMFWWFFNDEFALIQNTLGNEEGVQVTPMDPPPGYAEAQEAMFNRVSDCYTRMFWKVGLTMLTDDFFERFAEALADAVREAFDRGLEDSKHLFTDSLNDRDAKLRDLIIKWTTAITPRRAQPKAQAGRRNIRCGRFDAVGHSPLMASYMRRHGCVAPIGGSGCKHNLHRLEIELRHDKVQWGNSASKRQEPLVHVSMGAPRNMPKDKKVQQHTVLPTINATCGMGTFSQKKVDEVILSYLN